MHPTKHLLPVQASLSFQRCRAINRSCKPSVYPCAAAVCFFFQQPKTRCTTAGQEWRRRASLLEVCDACRSCPWCWGGQRNTSRRVSWRFWSRCQPLKNSHSPQHPENKCNWRPLHSAEGAGKKKAFQYLRGNVNLKSNLETKCDVCESDRMPDYLL